MVTWAGQQDIHLQLAHSPLDVLLEEVCTQSMMSALDNKESCVMIWPTTDSNTVEWKRWANIWPVSCLQMGD